MSEVIKKIEKEYIKKDVPKFNAGDTVRINISVVESGKERIQGFEGVVIAKRGIGISETFTVRRVSYGVGIERVFPLHSPKVKEIIVLRKGKVKRAKLYYLKKRKGKAGRIDEKREDMLAEGEVQGVQAQQAEESQQEQTQEEV